MPQLVRDEVTIVYDTFGDGEPLLLLCGCGQPAVAWHLTLVPALVEAGYRVITFDNRGVAPSSSPPPPYSIGQMVDDTLALLHHLGIEQARVAGHSMGGWIAETLAIEHPDRVRGAALMGSCNLATSWEKAITTVERDIALADLTMPPLYFATETLRYLPNSDLQDDAVVDALARFHRRHPAVAQPRPARPVGGVPGLVSRYRTHEGLGDHLRAVHGPGVRARHRFPTRPRKRSCRGHPRSRATQK